MTCCILKPFIVNIKTINSPWMTSLSFSANTFFPISSMIFFLKKVRNWVTGPLLQHGRALVHHFKEAISSAHIWKWLHSFLFLIQSSQMALCRYKLILVVMPILHNASNFMFPTERHKAWLQFVQMEWPSYQDHFCIQITVHGSDRQQKRTECWWMKAIRTVTVIWMRDLVYDETILCTASIYLLWQDHAKLKLNIPPSALRWGKLQRNNLMWLVYPGMVGLGRPAV